MVLPLDMPDDYPWLPGSGKSTLGDLGELAARLGSIVTYDRRGSVYWMDGFENGLSPWQTSGAGTGWKVTIVTTPTFRGGFSCKLVGGSDQDTETKIIKTLSPTLLTTYGVEATFSLDNDIDSIWIDFRVYTGSIRHLGQFLLRPETQKLYYLTSENDIEEIDDYTFSLDSPYLFLTAKLVIDFVSNQYIRVLLNQNEYDLSNISIYSNPNATAPHIEIALGVLSVDGKNAVAYVDDVINTVGEP